MTMEFFQGHQKSKKMGTWVIKERIINREHDKYYEHIEDEGGTLIHHCDEKLSEHQGHGSAKLLKKENLNE